MLETVEADQAERLVMASPTVAAAGVEDSLSHTLCQIDLLPRPEDYPLPGFDVP